MFLLIYYPFSHDVKYIFNIQVHIYRKKISVCNPYNLLSLLIYYPLPHDVKYIFNIHTSTYIQKKKLVCDPYNLLFLLTNYTTFEPWTKTKEISFVLHAHVSEPLNCVYFLKNSTAKLFYNLY